MCCNTFVLRSGPFPQDVVSRRDTVRGNLSMEQTENFYFVTDRGLQTTKRNRLHMQKATTAGTSIGPMPLPDWKKPDETFSLTYKDKKAIYGDARILPSGRMDGDQDLTGSGEKRVAHTRKDGDIEPVTYNGLHRHHWEELVHQVGGKGKVRCILDLTATEPTLAMVAMEWGIPYLGVTFGDFHQEAIKRRLVQLLFQRSMDPKSSLHIPGLQTLMMAKAKGEPATPADEDSGEDGEPAPKKQRSSLRQTLLSQLAGAGDNEPNTGED